MKRFPHLWQSVFVYSLVLIVISLGIGDMVHRNNDMEQSVGIALGISNELRHTLEGQHVGAANIILKMFSKHDNKFWIEDDAGNLIAGERFGGGRTAEAGFSYIRARDDGASLWTSGDSGTRYLVVAPLALQDRMATFYTIYSPPVGPGAHPVRYKDMLSIAIVAGLLTLWMAYAVCRPLRMLQREVSEIPGSLNLKRVTVTGNDEIADVAAAVNRLVEGLSRYVTGMRQLISNISHELRSPLARMTLSADMIGEGLSALALPPGPADTDKDILRREKKAGLAAKHLGMLQEELVHMDKLIGKTLLISTVEVRDPHSLTALIDMSGLCTSAAHRYEMTFEQARLRFEYAVEPGLQTIGDETLLMQVLSNLLDNAVKYTSDPAVPVRFMLKRRGEAAVLTVENSSDPLSEDSLKRIFEPFYRHEQYTGTGVGLGLSLVKKIAELHGGGASAENTGQGVRIRVVLPLPSAGSGMPGGLAK